LAINSRDNKEYAIKILDINKIIKENLDKNIEKEVALMRKINHPYIVKLFEVMSTNQKILLVMEYIDGGDLFDAISI
jgi:serine/threonine protein kinase